MGTIEIYKRKTNDGKDVTASTNLASVPEQREVSASGDLILNNPFGATLQKYLPSTVAFDMSLTSNGTNPITVYSVGAKIEMTNFVLGPIRLNDWSVRFTKQGAGATDYTIEGTISVTIDIGSPLNFQMSAKWEAADKLFTLGLKAPSAGEGDYIQLLPGMGFRDVGVDLVLDMKNNLIKQLSIKGSFATKDAELGPLSDAVKAFDGITAEVSFSQTSTTDYKFRISLGGPIRIKSNLCIVTDGSLFFEFGGKIPDFTVGGSVKMQIKTGKPDNYPIVSL